MLDIKRVLAAKPKAHEAVELKRLTTPWGQEIDPANILPEHPTPQFARAHYQILNGWWECAFVQASNVPAENAYAGKHAAPSRKAKRAKRKKEEAPATPAAPVVDLASLPHTVDSALIPPRAVFAQKILVPFSPEAPLSGVNRQLKPGELLWYRHTFEAPTLANGDRLLLHFQAVDHTCSLRINGTTVGGHAGGYLPFAFDITNYLVEGQNEIALCVADASEAAGQVRGKQRLDRGDIWYTAQSGIWKTVWLELAPANRIDRINIDTDAFEGSITVHAFFRDSEPRAHTPELSVEISDADGTVVATGAVPAEGDSCDVKFRLRNPRLWCPDDPHLYTILLTYGQDVVASYCGLRSVGVERIAGGRGRFLLNGQPMFLKGVLDQGYWPDGLMTAPSDDALVFDIQAAKAAGFNMMRKHIKLEAARWYYHCDRLGMLVWQDMVNGGDGEMHQWQWSYKPTLLKRSWNRYDDTAPENQRELGAGAPSYRNEWMHTAAEAIERLKGHPCIVTWVLFNEGWGQFDSAAACEQAAKWDPSRPIDAVSGWYDQGAGDFKSVHNYFRTLKVWPDAGTRPFVISECGGLTLHVEGHSALDAAYGYAAYEKAEAWAADLRALLARLDGLEAKGLAGYVYTQLTDIEEEVNGILTYDRRVNKLDLA
ncbi:MAG: glycoside hydrolase family 2 TIM barrel-domain containing protein [Coriobacteriia bacterium]|nr:glycoside hydrolase family 2 TIM barrel-domain containing protein [Coriobacteriia bacterium]